MRGLKKKGETFFDPALDKQGMCCLIAYHL